MLATAFAELLGVSRDGRSEYCIGTTINAIVYDTGPDHARYGLRFMINRMVLATYDLTLDIYTPAHQLFQAEPRLRFGAPSAEDQRQSHAGPKTHATVTEIKV